VRGKNKTTISHNTAWKRRQQALFSLLKIKNAGKIWKKIILMTSWQK
jgi:hypothetical protein